MKVNQEKLDLVVDLLLNQILGECEGFKEAKNVDECMEGPIKGFKEEENVEDIVDESLDSIDEAEENVDEAMAPAVLKKAAEMQLARRAAAMATSRNIPVKQATSMIKRSTSGAMV